MRAPYGRAARATSDVVARVTQELAVLGVKTRSVRFSDLFSVSASCGPGSRSGVGWPAGIAFGFASALASCIGFLMRHRGAVAAPDVDATRPLRTAVALFRERWWTLGYLVAALAWALHLAALKLAPLSLVQAALASSFVFLGVVAERLFGLPVERRQRVGMALAAAGLALLGLTAGDARPQGAESSSVLAGAIPVEAALFAAGLALVVSRRARGVHSQRGVLLAAAAGLLFTASHIGVKALSGKVSVGDPASLATPWVPVVVAAFLVAFFASARSLQVGDAVAVIAVTGATSNVTAIFSGMVVFGDPVGDGALVVGLRMAAFVLVVVAATFMPAPVRAAAAGEAGGGEQEKTRAAPREARRAVAVS